MNISNREPPAPTPGRPRDKSKHQAILEAAKCLFLSKGFEGSSMDAIAAEAGVSKLTVYNHFLDKDSLFVAAVESKCEEQLPQPFFEPSADTPIEQALLDIGRGFHALVSNTESIELHRIMLAQASSNARLSQLFLEAGPQRVMREMERLLTQAHQQGQLAIADPKRAAGHFFCLIKGTDNFRLLLGCCSELPDAAAVDAHIRDVVNLFIRAYRP